MTLLFQILILIAFSYLLGIILHQFVYYDTLIIDASIWRCGLDGYYGNNNKLGEGATLLLNHDGFMCCLGQITCQLRPDIPKEALLGQPYPSRLMFGDIPLLKKKGVNTQLSDDAVKINDNSKTTINEKIFELKSLFKEHGYRIKVINMHKIK
jgi:hypothetical protein